MAVSFQLATDLDWRTVRYPVAVEPKVDGVRCMVTVDADGTVHPYSRRGTEWTAVAAAPAIASLARFPGMTFDGELVIGGSWGTTNGAIHRKALSATDLVTAVFHAFDLPSHPGTYTERRAALEAMGVPVVASIRCETRREVEAEFARIVALGGEGIVAKALDSRYIAGRPGTWQKLKPQPTTDIFVDGECFETVNGRVVRVRDDKVSE